MQDEITARPLVDILSEQLGEPVVMSGDNYVFLSDKSVVAAAAVELALATQQENLVAQEQNQFRAERDKLLTEADIQIYKLEDTAQDATTWRAYRQALRDATLTWVMPEKPL